ncbi:MAG: NAD(P)-dependent oxidoreductase [Myxococcota bacterium]|nr:NAD(P)-dependent oxidoreductase [Myxococcota bacterium]
MLIVLTETEAKSGISLQELRGKQVWITGAGGFIGSELVSVLAGAGAIIHPYKGDVSKPGEVTSSLREANPDVLVNLAAPVDVRRDPQLQALMERTILGGLRTILDGAESLGTAPLLLQCGTCEEYGAIPTPFSEDDEPGGPVSPYAAAKLAASNEALERRPGSAVRCIVARPFLTYGPGQRGRQLIPTAIRAALERRPFPMTSGEQTREFNHVSDIALDLAGLLCCPEAEGQIVNLGCGEEQRVLDVVRLIFRLAGAPEDLIEVGALEHRDAEILRFYADVSRSRRLLGKRPRLSLREGLTQTIETIGSRMAAGEAS